MQNERIQYLDRIKGFTILLVVIAHVYIFSYGMTDTLVFKTIASFHMHLFMFVSGYVAYIPPPYKTNPTKKIIKRICSYVFPAYVISLIISCYLQVVPEDIKYISFNGYWYLKSLAIFCVIQLLQLKCKNIWTEFVLILCVLFMFFVGWKKSPALTEILCLEHNVSFYPFFLLGYYAKRFNIMSIVFKHNIFFTIGIIGYFCVSILFQFNDDLHTISDRYLVPSFAIIAIVYYFHHRETKNGYIDKYLGYIGTKTLDIYLYHCFFILHFNIFNIKEFSTSLFN